MCLFVPVMVELVDSLANLSYVSLGSDFLETWHCPITARCLRGGCKLFLCLRWGLLSFPGVVRKLLRLWGFWALDLAQQKPWWCGTKLFGPWGQQKGKSEICSAQSSTSPSPAVIPNPGQCFPQGTVWKRAVGGLEGTQLSHFGPFEDVVDILPCTESCTVKNWSESTHHLRKILEHFHPPRRNPIPLSSYPSPCLVTTHLSQSLSICRFWTFHINWIIQ